MKPQRVILREGQDARDLEPMLKDHHALLSGGMRLDTQMAGETKSFVFNRLHPVTLISKLTRAPSSVVCLSARLTTGAGSTFSGAVVKWTWGGTATAATITIDDLIGLPGTDDYNVSLWLSEG